jgi:rifampicin phosphotransferase
VRNPSCLAGCQTRHRETIFSSHMRHTAAAVVPTGDILAHVADWTKLPTAELLGLMLGTSPVSAGASAELERTMAAMAKDPPARELLASKDEREIDRLMQRRCRLPR